MIGGGENGVIDGSSLKDRIYGGGGNDMIRGFGGNDKLIGETGKDRLTGGQGRSSQYRLSKAARPAFLRLVSRSELRMT